MSERLQAMKDAHRAASKIEESEDDDSSSVKSEVSYKDTSDENSSTDGEDDEEEAGVEEVEDEEEEDEIEAEEQTQLKEVMTNETDKSLTFVCEALGDFSAEEASDLSFSRGDLLTVIGVCKDGWWEAENQDGKRGMVPSTFLKVPEKIQQILEGMQGTSQQHEKGKLWEKLRQSVHQSHAFEDTLSAIGALPVGFCQPSLYQLLQEDSRYSTEAFLAPKLRESGLSFRDLHWDTTTKTLKPQTTHLQRAIRLVAFRQVIPPSSDYDVTSRHVRICLHDGSKVLSNIHTIKAQWDPKVPKIWTFLSKNSSGGSCLEEGQFFIRSNATSPTIGVLFQLCVSYNKTSTGESGEMSCGWVFMRLLDDSGLAVPSRTRILHIQSGVPFMNQLGTPTSSGTKSGGLKMFMNRGKKPRLVVTISMLKRKHNQLLNFVPTSLIGQISVIPLLVMYRRILADKLLKQRISFDSTELVQSPFLSCFPKMFGQSDILTAFRKLWSEKAKKMKLSVTKNEEKGKTEFKQLFMETAFLILHCVTLPPFCLGNQKVEQERKTEISRIVKLVKEHGPLAISMSPAYQFHPLSIKVLSIDIIGRYSVPVEEIV